MALSTAENTYWLIISALTLVLMQQRKMSTLHNSPVTVKYIDAGNVGQGVLWVA